jgi:hypothetical protein
MAARTGVPCITTLPGALAAIQGIEALIRERGSGREPHSLQEYHAGVVRAGEGARESVGATRA